MRKPEDAGPAAYTYPTLPILDPSGGPSQPASAANTPSGRPIKPLVLPSSLKKASKKTPPQDLPKLSKMVVNEPRPPEAGSSLSMKDRLKAKANPFSDRPPSSPQGIEVSEDDDEDERQSGEEEERSEEEDSDIDDSDGSAPSPRKSPRRPIAEVLEDFKCASLASEISVTKPTSRGSAATATANNRPTLAASKAGSSSLAPSSSIAAHTLPFPRKLFVPTSSSAVSSSTAAPASAENSRKRKAPPTKYVYLDLSDDDDVVQASAGDEQEEEFLPKERRKTINGSAAGVAKPSGSRPGAPVAGGSGKDRRVSSAT